MAAAAAAAGPAEQHGLSKLTTAESTAVAVSSMRLRAASAIKRPDGSPLFDARFDQAFVDASGVVPMTDGVRRFVETDPLGPCVMGVRTAEIDHQLLLAVGAAAAPEGERDVLPPLPRGPIRQVGCQARVRPSCGRAFCMAGYSWAPWRGRSRASALCLEPVVRGGTCGAALALLQ